MVTRHKLSAEDFWARVEAGSFGLVDLVDGEVIDMPLSRPINAKIALSHCRRSSMIRPDPLP